MPEHRRIASISDDLPDGFAQTSVQVVEFDANGIDYQKHVLTPPAQGSGEESGWVGWPKISGDGEHVFAFFVVTGESGLVQTLWRWDRGTGPWATAPVVVDTLPVGNQASVPMVSNDGSIVAYLDQSEWTENPKSRLVRLRYIEDASSTPVGTAHTPESVTEGDNFTGVPRGVAISGDGHWLVYSVESWDGTDRTEQILVRHLSGDPNTVTTLVNGGPDDQIWPRDQIWPWLLGMTIDVSDGGRYVVWASEFGSFGVDGVPEGGHVFVLDRDYDLVGGVSTPNGTFDETGADKTRARYLPGLDFNADDETGLALSAPRISGNGTTVTRRSFEGTCPDGGGNDEEKMPKLKTVDQSDGDRVEHVDMDVHEDGCPKDLWIDFTGEHVVFGDITSYWPGDSNGHVDYYSFQIDDRIWPEFLRKKKGSPGSTVDAGDPTSTSIGNFHFDRTDLRAPGFGVEFSRTYNSWGDRPSESDGYWSSWLSTGWSHSYAQHLTDGDDGAKNLILPDEREVTFPWTGGVYGSPRELDASLASVAGGFEVTFRSGVVWKFDSGGKLVELRSGQGETVTVAYDSGTTRLAGVENTTTHWKLIFGYDSGDDDLIDKVTLTDGATNPMIRTVAFGYGPNTGAPQQLVLTSASQPFINPEVDPRGVETYTVDPWSVKVTDVAMTGVKYDNVEGVDFSDAVVPVAEVHVEYRADGRVAKETTLEGDVVTFSYDDANQLAKVTNEGKPGYPNDDDVNTYVYSTDGDTTEIRDPADNDTQRTFDAYGRLKTVVDRAGTESGIHYDEDGRVIQRATADPNTGEVPDPGPLGWSEPGPGDLWGLETITYLDDFAGGVPDFRVAETTTAAGQKTKYCYKPIGSGSTASSVCATSTSESASTRGVNSTPTLVITGYDGDLDGANNTAGDSDDLSQFEIETRTALDSVGRTIATRDGDGVTMCMFYNTDGTVKSSGQLNVSTTNLDFASVCATNETNTTNYSKTSFIYDGLGQLTDKVTPNLQGTGKAWKYTYWATGQQRSETDPDATSVDDTGHATKRIYHPLGHVLSSIDQLGFHTDTTISWNQTGTDNGWPCYTAGNGCRTETVSTPYDGDTRHETVQIYDKFGDLREARQGTDSDPSPDAVTTYSYGDMSRLTTTTDPTGVVRSFEYDEEGRVTKTTVGSSLTAGDNAVTETVFDRLGRATQVTSPSVSTSSLIRPVTAYVYDKAGRVIQTAQGDPADGVLPGTSGSCAREANGKFPIPKVGNCSSKNFTLQATTYLANGLVERTGLYRADTNHVAGTEAWRKVFYTPGGRVKCVDTRVQDANGASLPETSIYDATDYTYGRVTATRHQIGSVSSSTRCDDSPSSTTKWAISAVGYNADGTVEWQQTPEQFIANSNPADSNHFKYRTTFTYDNFGRRYQTRSPNPDVDAAPSTPTVLSTTCYTARGEVMAVIDPANNVTGYAYYKAAGLVKQVADPTGMNPVSSQTGSPCGGLSHHTDAHKGTVDYAYDARGNRVSRTSWEGSTSRTETFTFDLANRPLTTSSGASTNPVTTEYLYTITNGRVTQRTTRTGDTADSSRRQTVESFAPSGSLTTVRSETCTINDCSSVGSRYIQTTNTYDWAGRRSAVALDDQAWGGAGTDTTTSFEYNSAGDITKVTYPDAKTMTINRDLTGKPTGHKYPDTTIYKYVYDAGQRLYKAQLFYFPIYVDLAEYTYNADGAVIDETLGGSMSSRRQWTRNSANGAVDKYVQNLSTDNRTTPIKYDADGRIRQDCKGTGTGGACNDGTNSTTDTDVRTVYSYDTASQLTQAEINNDTTTDAYTKWEYTYGNRGQRTSQKITKNTSGATYVGYAYDANQQLCRSETSTSSAPTPTCSASGSTVTSYDYDRAGRRTQVVTPGAGNYTRTFTYDPRGILEQSSNTPTGASTTTTYIANNAFGQLTCRNTASAANCQTTGPTTTNNYLYWDHSGTTGAVPQVLQGMVDNIDFRYVYGGSRISLWGYFFGQDHLANTTNLKGQSTVTTYSPYGEVLNSAPNTFQYRGELGWTAGLYLRNRNYDPTTGTFTTRDPLDGVDGTTTVANAYHYVDNDPINKRDPLGLRPGDCGFQEVCNYVVSDTALTRAGDIDAVMTVSGGNPLGCYRATDYGGDVVAASAEFHVDPRLIYGIFVQETSGCRTASADYFLLGASNSSLSGDMLPNLGPTNMYAASFLSTVANHPGLIGGNDPFAAWASLPANGPLAARVMAARLQDVSLMLTNIINQRPDVETVTEGDFAEKFASEPDSFFFLRSSIVGKAAVANDADVGRRPREQINLILDKQWDQLSDAADNLGGSRCYWNTYTGAVIRGIPHLRGARSHVLQQPGVAGVKECVGG